MKYALACHSRQGSRASNQDRVLVVEREHAVLLALADGLGGHAGGALAAELALHTLGEAFRQFRGTHIEQPSQFLALAFAKAHRVMREAGERRRPPIQPRTTCVACIIQDGYAYWAHVGDSRLYHFRHRQLVARTRDHTQIETWREAGVVDAAESRSHPDTSRLLSCLGGRTPPEPALGAPTALQERDILLLCSDGLWGSLSPDALRSHLEAENLEEALETLILTAERKDRPHGDNVSGVTLRWLDRAAPQRRPAVARKPPAPAPSQAPIESASLDAEIAALEALVRPRRP